MNILITGARGFIGRNFVCALENIRDGKERTTAVDPDMNILEYDVDSDPALLDQYCRQADFVFHLAGVNRPKEQAEFMKGNFGFTSVLLDTLRKYANTCPVMISSSIQAALDNPYGKSKKAGEDLLLAYGQETGAKVLVYRFPNVFGKWCRPNYNSAVATFCHNIANGLPITVNDRDTKLTLVYIDDVVEELLRALCTSENRSGSYCKVSVEYTVTLGQIVDLLYSFQASRKERSVPDLSDAFTVKLYAAYLSYCPAASIRYPLKMNQDERGSFTEILRTADRGQFSVNISKPGVTKGNHWHQTKNEKFVVVHGRGRIQLRKVGTDPEGSPYPVVSFDVSGEELEVVEMIPGYTHNVINLSDTEDLVTFMWASECFDPQKPDTYFLEV